MVRINSLLIIIMMFFGLFFVKHQETEKVILEETLAQEPAPRVSEKWEQSVEMVLPKVLSKYKNEIKRAARLFDVEPEIIASIIVVESMGNPRALSPKGARGCMQTLPSTDVELGMHDRDSFDCPTSIVKGTKYLASLRDRYGITDSSRVIVAYSDGPNRTKKYTEEEVQNNIYLYKVNAVIDKIPDDVDI